MLTIPSPYDKGTDEQNKSNPYYNVTSNPIQTDMPVEMCPKVYTSAQILPEAPTCFKIVQIKILVVYD
jgi:hypothetical protein